MAITALTGTRLRERRLALGFRQADLARKAGISASYLNLIEHNRRKVSPDVLGRLAGLLDSDARTLGEGTGGRLPGDLRAAAATGLAAPELDGLEDFIGRFPGWASLVAVQHARLGALDRAVTALNDRLTHDPRLSHALHEVLSSIASVRATAAILAETGDLTAEWHDRFLANLHGDSERLARGAEALVAHLDEPASAEPAILSPQEEMEAWFAAHDWQVTTQPEGLSDAAHDLALRWLARMRSDAAIPLADLAGDPAQIAARHGVGILSVLRRIAMATGAGLAMCDASGTLTFRKPAEGFDLPRFGAACPLWPLYAALASSRPVEAEVEMAGDARRRYRIRAFAESRFPQGFAGPEIREAAMLIEPALGTGPALPVGTTCRICPRDPCIARREPSILRDGAHALR